MADTAKVHLVGSIPGDSATDVFRLCGKTVGNLVRTLPDGETGYRQYYIGWLGYSVYRSHPDLEVVAKPHPIDPSHPEEWRQPGQEWLSREVDRSDFWKFRIRDSVSQFSMQTLGYADAAIESYAEFVRLRAAGEIPEATRFQVSLPSAGDGAGAFVADPEDLPRFLASYESAMADDLARILDAIPASDLAIQWDNVGFVIGHELERSERQDTGTDGIRLGRLTENFRQMLDRFLGNVPDDVAFGIHFCYGDFRHRHSVQPRDLAVPVFLANEALSLARRSIDWIHMPVPRNRADEDYFRPLLDMRADTRLFLGLVHHTDGMEGTTRRIEVAKRCCSDFGISTECGLGRRPREQIPELLEMYFQAAALL